MCLQFELEAIEPADFELEFRQRLIPKAKPIGRGLGFLYLKQLEPLKQFLDLSQRGLKVSIPGDQLAFH